VEPSSNLLSGTVVGPTVQARSVSGGIHFHEAGPSTVPTTPHVPRELPLPPPFLVGRSDELDTLSDTARARSGSRTVVVLHGIAGVGKTALALRWLHGLATEFADGHLYADLQGHGGGRPVAPEQILERFLRSLGVSAKAIPASMADQVSLYRSLTAGRRLLVMLDDATLTEQAQPLLPASADSVVAITSRRGMRGLLCEGAVSFGVGPLARTAAVALVQRLVGERRVQAEQESAATLAAFCGGLPLALCVAGARLASRPSLTLGRATRELADERDRLGALFLEDGPSVQGVFDVSYRNVPSEARRLYRLAALHPGPEFSSGAAAAAAGVTVARADRLLDVLVDAHLLENVAEDQYRYHDLLRAHARGVARAVDTRPEWDAAIGRIIDWYLATASAADCAVMPHRRRPGRLGPLAGTPAEPVGSFDGAADALEWLEAEHINLAAAVRQAADLGWWAAAWQLVEAMWSLFLRHKHYRDWMECHRIGLTAVRECANPQGEMLLLNHLGLGLTGLGRYDQALDTFLTALGIARDLADHTAQATALNSLGLALQGLDRRSEAITRFDEAAAIQAALGERRGEALTRVNLGRAHLDEGRLDEAAAQLMPAHRTFVSLPDAYNAARALASLGVVDVRAGRPVAGQQRLRRAWQAMGECGSRFEQAEILEFLGEVALSLGDAAEARRCFESARATFADIGSPRGESLNPRQLGPAEPGSRLSPQTPQDPDPLPGPGP
jgi:tetratricopeptide (TPR) repeat protein